MHFACKQALSNESPDVQLPDEIANETQPFMVAGAWDGSEWYCDKWRNNVKYMLLAYSADGVYTDETKSASLAESIRLCHDLNAKGQYLDASPLQPITTATSVRVRDGKRLITDGPFAETREHLGGYFLIEAADLDEALEIAGRVPGARLGTVEVRPLVELDGMP